MHHALNRFTVCALALVALACTSCDSSSSPAESESSSSATDALSATNSSVTGSSSATSSSDGNSSSIASSSSSGPFLCSPDNAVLTNAPSSVWSFNDPNPKLATSGTQIAVRTYNTIMVADADGLDTLVPARAFPYPIYIGMALAFDGTEVFWSIGDSIMATRVDNKSVRLVVEGSIQPTSIAVDANNVYFATYAAKGLWQAPLAGGSATLLTDQVQARNIITQAGKLYVADIVFDRLLTVDLSNGGLNYASAPVTDMDNTSSAGDKLYLSAFGSVYSAPFGKTDKPTELAYMPKVFVWDVAGLDGWVIWNWEGNLYGMQEGAQSCIQYDILNVTGVATAATSDGLWFASNKLYYIPR